MQETFPEDGPATHTAGAFARHTAGETIWVAENGRDIVGLVTFWPAEPFIHFLLVLPPWRRRGIGAALMKAATRGVEGSVDLKCRIDNEMAQRFYEALGWREVGRDLDSPEPFIRYRQ